VFATADALAKLWEVDTDDLDKMLGVQAVANAFVNLDLIARRLSARQEATTSAPVRDEDEEGSGG
jgi:hypothetical protein